MVPIPGCPNLYSNCEGTAINDRGEVAGTEVGDAPGRAFRWTESAGLQMLVDRPISEATGLNDLGQIVGWSADWDSTYRRI